MKKTFLVLGVFALAFCILLVSIFNSSAIKYPVLLETPPIPPDNSEEQINYIFPYMGRILPDSPLWTLKAVRDKVWFSVTPYNSRKAELALLFSDKRLLMAKELFKRGEAELALSTYTKGEKYLEIAVSEEAIARANGVNTDAFLVKLATAALKHKEVAESLIQLAPEDARPLIIKTEYYAKNTYELTRNALNSRGIPVPNNPFDWD